MNSKNIPADIKRKSIEEAQKEVSEIIEILEKEENLENSIEKYHRLIFLNNYIEQKFKDKSKNISKKNFKNYRNFLIKKLIIYVRISKKNQTNSKGYNKYLHQYFKKQDAKSYLLKPMKYGLFSGGKGFRSKIIVDTGKIFNINYNLLKALSAAVECVHSYSLIHDDLPCMDNDDIRRGKLSTHKKFGESTAILSGNSLLTLAFEILSDKKLTIKK